MSWKPHSNQAQRKQRAQLNRDVREFFHLRDVLEVETPALSQAGNTDPFIESIQTPSQHTSRYLHTSPEYPMKRLLADGSGDIYQLCKVWRAGEVGKHHNPEFTLLEWYRVGFHYHQLMQEVSDLLHQVMPFIVKDNNYYSYQALFLEKFGINPHIAKHDELEHCVKNNIAGLDCQNLDPQALLDALLTHCIEPDFSKDRLTFVFDYPVSQSALAQIRDVDTETIETSRQAEQEKDGAHTATAHKANKMYKKGGGVLNINTHPVAERFEVYLGTMELGNGYQEEVNYVRNKHILEAENRARKKMGLAKVSQDEYFLDACQSGIPASSGVAIGLDRVLMCISNVESIQDVLNFPWDTA